MNNSTTAAATSTIHEGSGQVQMESSFYGDRPENRDRESLSENFIGELDAWIRNTLTPHGRN